MAAQGVYVAGHLRPGVLRDRDDGHGRLTTLRLWTMGTGGLPRLATAADLLIVSGRVSHKMAPVVRQFYDQMPNPKWVIAMGACASTGGMFNNYAILAGVDHIVPVDIYVPGCPPRPDMLIDAIFKLRQKIVTAPIGVHLRAIEAAEESVALGAVPLTKEASHV